MQYETESLGQRKFYFEHDNHNQVEFVVAVDVQNTSRDSDILDLAYGKLQEVFPDSWHSWRLFEELDNF